jgi:hypothetical protein
MNPAGTVCCNMPAEYIWATPFMLRSKSGFTPPSLVRPGGPYRRRFLKGNPDLNMRTRPQLAAQR